MAKKQGPEKEMADCIFERGDQIIYVPLHAEGNTMHPDCQFGFVTSARSNIVWCRYWYDIPTRQLRTKSNSESCGPDALRLHNAVPQHEVEKLLAQIEKGINI